MKQLTVEEFQERSQAVLRAKSIFIDSGVTKNISIAFELYQKVCAERERDIFISNQAGSGLVMDKYERPKCPDCASDMMFRRVPENDAGIVTQLVCSNKECDVVLDSEHDLSWWMRELKVKV